MGQVEIDNVHMNVLTRHLRLGMTLHMNAEAFHSSDNTGLAKKKFMISV